MVGESGSGKSTVALAILGLLGPEATIRRNHLVSTGRDLAGMRPRIRHNLR